ncbi:MAG: hypothetical protein ACJ75J_15740 [Cytophagaceae bacterium]
MKKEILFQKSFLILFLIVSSVVFLLKYLFPEIIHDRIWIIQIYFFLSFGLTYLLASKVMKNMPDQMHIYYLGAMAVRFILSILFIFICLIVSKADAVVFAMDFFIIYLVYSWFEIYLLLRNLRADLKRQ